MDERNSPAEALNRYWDRLLEGSDVISVPGPDESTRAVLRELQISELSPAPREAFIDGLRLRLFAEAHDHPDSPQDMHPTSINVFRPSFNFGRWMSLTTASLVTATILVASVMSFVIAYESMQDRAELPPQHTEQSIAGPTPSQNAASDAPSSIGTGMMASSLSSGAFELIDSSASPGRAWHSVVDVEAGSMYQYQFSTWTTETWQRTLADGTVQIAVEVRDVTGQVVARYVQAGDRWWIEQGNRERSGTGEPDRLPMELTPYRPLSNSDLDTLVSKFQDAQIRDLQEDGKRVVEFRFDASAEESDPFKQLFGVALSHQLWTYEFGGDDDVVDVQTFSLVDSEGESHLQRQNHVVVWEQLAASDVTDDRFEIEDPGPASTADGTFTVPSETELPLGLHLSTHDTDLPMGGERLIFVGDGSLVVELRVIPDAFIMSDFEGYKESQTTFGSIRWRANDDSGAPVRAFWIADSYSYSVFAYNRPAWTEADLVAFAEALVNAQGTQ